MRILIPNYPLPDSFEDNVKYTLEQLGHSVITPARRLDRKSNRPIDVAKELINRIFPQNWSEAEKWTVATARSETIDLVLCLTLALRQEVLELLRRAGVRHLAAWWGDTPANMRGMGLLAQEWDAVFLKDAHGVAKFRAVGIDATLLHEAMNPAWHKRMLERIGPNIIVAGSYYGYRQYLVERLLDAGEPMALYGPAPPKWSSAQIKAAHNGRYVVKEEKSRVFGEGLACLNSTALSEGNSLNCRAFEIAGTCGLQLIEDKSAVAMCFEPGREVLTYRSVDEIREHLERARRDPKWAMSIREAGCRRANAEHTYEHRMRAIFSRLAR